MTSFLELCYTPENREIAVQSTLRPTTSLKGSTTLRSGRIRKCTLLVVHHAQELQQQIIVRGKKVALQKKENNGWIFYFLL